MPRPPRVLAVLAGGFVLAFALVYAVAFGTRFGRDADLAVFRHAGDFSVESVRALGQHVVDTIDVASLTVGTAAAALVALARREPRRAAAAVGVVGLAALTARLLKEALGRLDPAGGVAARGFYGDSFPSGHAAIAASLGLALVIAAPPVLRPTAAALGAAYAAGVGFAMILLRGHLASDIVGGYLLAGFWACVVVGALGASARRPRVSRRGLAVAGAAVGVALAVAAAVARSSAHAVDATLSARALVATAALLGALSLAMFAVVTPLVAEREG